MSAVNKLLDKTREACSISTDVGLAEKLGVSRQLVNQWRKGANPMSDERIAQIAGIAGEDVSTWLVLVRAEQTHGDAGRAWAKLARQLGAAAALAVVGLFVALPGQARASAGANLNESTHYALCEVVDQVHNLGPGCV